MRTTAGAAEPASRPPAAHPDDRNRWAILAVVLSGFFMILLDGTIMNVAIPPLQQDLSASYSAAQWMMSGYALAYGLVLIPAGRLGDRFGHRKMFIIGLTGFTVTSLLCGTATGAAQVVGWRVLQGLTAGLMNPAILATIQGVFPPSERGRAFGWFGATAGIASALGPVVGGLLIAGDLGGMSWRPIFLLNIPVGIVALVAAVRLLPEQRGRGGSLDPVGIVAITGTLLLLIYPLIQGYEAGWPAWVFVCLAAFPPALAVFLGWQVHKLRSGGSPLIDVRLFRARSFAVGVSLTLCQFVAFASMQFALSVYLQLGLNESALAAGLALLPFAVGTFLGSYYSDRMLRRLGRLALHLGSGLLVAGSVGAVLTIRHAGLDTDGWWLALPTLLAGMGAMLIGAPLLNIALADVPGQEAGSAGGIIATGQRLGHALGIAIVGTALFAVLPSGARDAKPGALAAEYTDAIQFAGLFAIAAAVVTFALIYLLPRDAGLRRAGPPG